MKYLDFRYCENKKCYYTDGHERDDVVKDRNDRFLIKYFEAELQAYRWVQITESEALDLEKDDFFPRNCSYNYVEEVDGEMCSFREYHIDTNDCLQEKVLDENIIYGANLSIRRDTTTKTFNDYWSR